MKPIQLTMCGWGSYPNKVIVDFTKFYNDGLFLVTGPTGAGKTTIFDAISFALYGDVSGKTREKTSVRSDFATPETDTYVELTFNHKGDTYKIVRSPKYSRPKKRGDGFTTSNETAVLHIGDATPIVSLNEVNRKINETMGINYEQFKKIAMIAQGEFLELLISSSKDRVEILRNLFKTNQYEKLQYLLSDKAKNLYKQIEEYRHKAEEAIHLMDTRENESLNQLCNAPNLNYDNIIEESKNYVREDKKLLREQEKELITLNEKIKDLIASFTKGEQLNANIDKLNQVTILWESKLKEQEDIKGIEDILAKATNAEKVRADESIYVDALEKHSNLSSKVQRLQIGITQLEPEVKKSFIIYKEAIEKESAIEQLQNEYAILEGFLPVIDELIKIKYKLALLEKEITLLERKEESLKITEDEQKKVKIECEREFNSYQEIDRLIGENNLLQQIGEAKEKKYQEVYDLTRNLNLERKKLSSLQETYEKANVELKDLRDIYQRKEEAYKNAIVGVVAKMVKEKEPCPVCGSTNHPHVATILDEIPDEEELDKLNKQLDHKKIELDNVYQDTAKKKAEVDSIIGQLTKGLEELEIPYEPFIEEEVRDFIVRKKEEHIIYLNSLDVKIKELSNKRVRLIALQKEIEALDSSLTQIGEQRKENILLYHEKKSEQDVLKGNLEQLNLRLSKHFPGIYVDETIVKTHIGEQMNQLKSQIVQMKEKIRIGQESYELIKSELLSTQTLLNSSETEFKVIQEEVKVKKDRFLKSLLENKFQEEEEYKIAIRSLKDMDLLSKQIKEYYEQLQSLEQTKLALAEQVGDRIYVNLVEISNQLEDLERKQQTIQLGKESLIARITGNQKLNDSIQVNLGKKRELEVEYGIIKDLDNVTKGNNKERLVFEQYVLASYFEDIIIAANQRLTTMTGGRYELLKVGRVADARTTDSLNLEVLDNYTGKKRSVKTLSGGESFKAALSLALGLSDIVQSNAGGIKIDTLFIDEGFGSLDTESLDQALDTLTSLTEHNRFIGIISHVNELKERIDNQIVVEKCNHGSKIKVI